MKRCMPILATVVAGALWLPVAAQADFGIKSMSAEAVKEDESPELRAGAHPYEFKLDFEMNQDAQEEPEGRIRELIVDLPPGMVGNPLAAGRCLGADFEGFVPRCPGNTQIGVARIRQTALPGQTLTSPIYNLTPPAGVPASLGFSIAGFNSFQEASLRSSDYGVRISDITVPTSVPLQSIEAEIWGVPSAKSHDPNRFCIGPEGEKIEGCSSDAAPIPFLSLPTSCEAPLKWTLSVNSVEEPEVLDVASDESVGPGGAPRGLGNCNGPPFNPTVVFRPETATSDSPTGLHVNLHIPQSESVTQVVLEPRDEVQRLRVSASSGSFTLSFKEQSTGELPFNASAAEVQSALQALPTIGAGNALVSGGSGSYLITFAKALSQKDVPLIEGQFLGEGEAAVSLVKQGRPPGELGPEPGIATAHLKDTVVTLPQGLALNPSAADGTVGCPLSGPEGINLPGSGESAQSEAAKCPDASRVGMVKVNSPLIDHPLRGTVYLARQGSNPFGSLIALYIAVNDPQSGIVVKLAGKVEPDPQTGRLETTFLDNPQLPFEDFDFEFFGGPRAALTTPPTCGKYTTATKLTPWTSPEGADRFPFDSFKVTSGPSGGCANSEAQMPNSPALEAGTTAPLAARYSPFVLKLNRENGSQRIAALNTTLPPGLTGKLAGVERCSEAQLAVAASRNKPGDGALEKQSPSCPAGSEVGSVTVGAGSGAPLYVGGKAYLAGPYKGAPLSLAIVTPAVAGPFDLGAVLVRAAAYVDPKTAQIRVKSDPIPQILEGIPLDVRSVAVKIDRDRFTLNPTNCDPMSIGAGVVSSLTNTALLSNRFQVGGCKGLDFEPKFSLRLKGGTKRGDFPKLIATVKAKEGEANIARASVKLPRSAFLAQEHIRTVCTRVQFAADACPKGSIYGKATATTPLLDEPLSGNVYLRSSNNKLPDLVVDLRGPASLPVRIELAGRTDSVKGALRNTFDLVPDAPVSKFRLELLGGKRGLVVNSRDICARTQRATVKLRAHSGAAHEARPVVRNDCGKREKRSRGEVR
jgi:hypothetical protein